MREFLMERGRKLMERGRAMRSDKGVIDIGGILIMGIGMVFVAVGLIIYPIIMDATDELLEYSCSANASIVAATFTGFSPIVGITPLLVLIGFLSAVVFSMYLGVKVMKGGAGGTKIDLGTMLMLGISMIFIAIGLIILPVALDGVCTVLTGDGSGIASDYSGLEPILKVTPLLLLISFISGSVVSGFFGLKRIGAG